MAAHDSEVDALKKELNDLRGEISELAAALGEAGLDQAKSSYRQVRARGGQAAETMSDKIEEKPLTSVFSALGIGIVIGLLLGRRGT